MTTMICRRDVVGKLQPQLLCHQYIDEFDLQDLCSLLKEPIKNVNSCVSKGQLKTLCKQLLVENVALRKMIIK